MAAGSWIVFDRFKHYVGGGSINLLAGNHILRCTLHTSAAILSAGATSALSVYNSVLNECAEENGYSSSGKTMSATTWITGASGGEKRFDSTAVFWSANGGAITNIKFAVLWFSAAASANRYLLAFSTLSATEFNLTDTNRLTITPSANGLFELN